MVGRAECEARVHVDTYAGAASPPPEKKLTVFVLRLAVLEKTASGIGTLGYIWGTTVLLGSFVANLDTTDFCFVSFFLLIKRSWSLSTAHRLQWQLLQSDDYSSNSNSISIIKAVCRPFSAFNMGSRLLWIELASATACVHLSLIKLVHPNHQDGGMDNCDKRNMKASLITFYALALAEALLFLLEKGYWEWKVTHGRLFESVNQECGFGSTSITRYFCYAYSRSINGSIFDGSKTNMVSFGMELILGSNSPGEQVMGAGILRNLATSWRFSEDTLHMIGINLAVLEKLVDMLSWKDAEIKYSASEILLKLAGKTQNSLRIAGIPGALKSIASLLALPSNEDYGLDQRGLDILKGVARVDHDACREIGNTKGLLRKIIDLIHVEEESLVRRAMPTPSQIVRAERALEVLKILASVPGAAGKQLRKQISEIVYTISYLRDILKHGDKQPQLQILGIEILMRLAVDEGAAESIGGTGGVVEVLFDIFFNDEIPENQSHVRVAAGEAVAVLVVESESACRRVVMLRQNGRLIKALQVPLLRENAARILGNLCAYGGGEHFNDKQLNGLTVASSAILEAIMKLEENKLQEVMIGAASCVLKLMSPWESKIMFKRAGIGEFDLASRLLLILNKHKNPSMKVPSIRRYAIEVVIWMMRSDNSNVGIFNDLGMQSVVESVMGTTSELECFTTLSGNVGVRRHRVGMHSLLDTAMELLKHKVYVMDYVI